MIARIRGEHDARWRWRPSAAREAAEAPRQTATVDDRQSGAKGLLRHRVLWWLLSVGVSIAVGCLAAIWLLSPSPARPQLPATPRAWLDAYEAAAIDNPSHVCSELFAPQLAEAYGNAVHGSCSSYFRRITSFSVVVRRVLQDGGTAVLELRQTVRPEDWAVVLNRQRAGWQAVDLLTGAPGR